MYIPTLLTLFENNREDSCIYTDKANIVEMLKNLNINLSIYCPQESCRPFISSFREKKKLREWIKGKDINKVYFFHEGYCEVANWMMLQLAKSDDIEFHYVPIARSYPLGEIEGEKGYRATLRSLYCKVVWGYKPIYPKQDISCGVMPSLFYDKLRIKEEETVEINKEIGKSILSNDYDENGIVLLDNPNLTDKESQNDYCDFLDSALRPILNYYAVYFKNHPGRTQKIGLENEIMEIPSFISGNLLTRRFRAFVGVNSALLCEAANDGSMAICMVYLVDLDESTRENIVRYHQMLSDKVYFPKTIEELSGVLLKGNC